MKGDLLRCRGEVLSRGERREVRLNSLERRSLEDFFSKNPTRDGMKVTLGESIFKSPHRRHVELSTRFESYAREYQSVWKKKKWSSFLSQKVEVLDPHLRTKGKECWRLIWGTRIS